MRKFLFRRNCVFIAVSCIAICGRVAHAQDVVKWQAGLTVSADDNFLRGPSGTEVPERTTTQNLGVTLSLPYSLQRFELDASVVNRLHQEFSRFDYTGYNYNAAWVWSFTPDFHGSLSSVRTESLNAAGDSPNPSLRNKNVTTTTGLQAVYELGGVVQLLGGAVNASSINEQSVLGQATENRSTSYNLGVGYSLSSGSSLKYNLRYDSGTNSTQTINTYTLSSHEVAAVWAMSGATTLNARLTYFDQRVEPATQQGSNGFTGGVNIVWRLSGKTTISAGLQRDSSVRGSSVQTDSLTINPSWQVSPKTTIALQYRNALRDDKGGQTGALASRQDRIQDTNVSYTWQPKPYVSVGATLGYFNRSSSFANQDYAARVASLSAQFNY